MRTITTLLGFALLLASANSWAQLRVLSCEPEWTALLQELGGDKLNIYTATNAYQDPHHLEARPSVIAKARRADLLVCTGAELEIGWLPILLRNSGNGDIRPGEKGYFMATDHVELLEIPEVLDRSMGDVHASGNPHVHLDPRRMGKIATALAARLQSLDSANADYYQQQAADFNARWQAATQKWQQQAQALKGKGIVTHHRSWIYFTDWLGLKTTGTLEPKPGIPPSARHLAELLSQVKAEQPVAIIRGPVANKKASEWLSERSGIPALLLPYTVGAEGAENLFQLFDITLQRLVTAAQ